MSGVVSKINEYVVLTPGGNNVNQVGIVETKQNAYVVLTPGHLNDSFIVVSKMLVYVVLDTEYIPEVWTGNFGTAGYANPAPTGFGAWNPPST